MPTAQSFTPPPVDRYIAALRAVPNLRDRDLRILRAHYEAPERTVTAKQLAQLVGYSSYAVANAQYGRLARLIGKQLAYNPEPESLGTLVRFEKRRGEWHWLMRPELATALEELGWVGSPSASTASAGGAAVSAVGSRAAPERIPRQVRKIENNYQPSAVEYVAGLQSISETISQLQRRIILSHYSLPRHEGTASEIARAANLQGGYPVVNLQYAKLAQRLCDAIGYEPTRRGSGSHRWWTVWSTGKSHSRGFVWRMLPQVVEALRTLEWHAPRPLPLPEELPNRELFEGAASRILVNKYERNPVAREGCIAHYGPTCVVCGFDFGLVYGDEASGFIHVHHLRRLSELSAEYQVDPVRDLRPVCPNCHAVIHVGGATRSIDEVRSMIARSKANDRKPPNRGAAGGGRHGGIR